MSGKRAAPRRLLAVMCGLPGSGKSTLARALADRLGALRWDKDELRHLLFPPSRVGHDRELNDACMALLYAGLPRAFARVPVVILDGRPYATGAQRQLARRAAGDAGDEALFIVCTAPVPVLRQRLDAEPHLAADRDSALLDRLAAEWEPFDDTAVILDTSASTPGHALEACLRALRARGMAGLDRGPQKNRQQLQREGREGSKEDRND